MQTVLSAEVPRVECSEHGVLLVRVPWAETGSRFTAMFEAIVIDLLKVAPILAAAHARDPRRIPPELTPISPAYPS